MRIAYYPGCEAKIIATEANKVTRMVLEKLGIELVELENAGCCGSMDLRLDNMSTVLTLGGRILALAEEIKAYKLLTVCNTCALNLNTAISVYNRDDAARAKLNEILSLCERRYNGTMDVITLPWLLIRLVGFISMRKATKKPLDKLRIAPFYGCHMIRPMKFYGFENSMKPSSIDVMIREFFDGQTLNYQGKSSCCGFHTLLTEEETSTGMIGYVIRNATSAGADCIVTPCAQCHTALDTYQQKALKEKGGKDSEIPVLHLSQLVGLAMGIAKEEMGFERHMVSPSRMLEGKGF